MGYSFYLTDTNNRHTRTCNTAMKFISFCRIVKIFWIVVSVIIESPKVITNNREIEIFTGRFNESKPGICGN